MQGSRFKELEAYKLSVALADELRIAVLGWGSFDVWSTGIQLLRAADSVGANIAEGYGRHGTLDQRRFLYVARGSAYEAEHWINRAFARGLLSDVFQPRITRVVQTLNGLIRAHRRNA
jgi:four helix bundle protein